MLGYTWALALLLYFVSAVPAHCSVVVDTLVQGRVRTPSSRQSRQLTAVIGTYLILPGIAYVLAVFTNLGTTFVSANSLQDQRLGWRFLSGGALLLLLTGLVAMFVERRRLFRPWYRMADFAALRAELEDVSASVTQPDMALTAALARRLRELREERPDLQQRRNARAYTLTGRSDLDARMFTSSYGWPALSTPDGSRIAVPWGTVARWLVRVPFQVYLLILAATGPLFLVLDVLLRDGRPRYVLVLPMYLVAILAHGSHLRLSFMLAARRQAAQRDAMRACSTMLRRWTSLRPRSRADVSARSVAGSGRRGTSVAAGSGITRPLSQPTPSLESVQSRIRADIGPLRPLRSALRRSSSSATHAGQAARDRRLRASRPSSTASTVMKTSAADSS